MAALRIAVVLKDRCQPKKCQTECIKFCPRVRSGERTIVLDEKGKPTVQEELCVGCGICINKCPFEAIKIIGLPSELKEDLVHQYSKNGFRLFRLPTPRPGVTIGLLGPNGIGKTTVLSILSGQLVPNLGDYEGKPDWGAAIERFSGTELHDYLVKIKDKKLVAAMKPQYVDRLPAVHSGKVQELLDRIDASGAFEVARQLDLGPCLGQALGSLSGGELQRVAVAATILRKADVYFFDEPSSYLDIYQRLKVARIIRSLSADKCVVVVEHDLAALDFLANDVYLMYGSEGVYGVLGQPRSVRNGINTYLDGYMREENIRFRDRPIRFETKAPREDWKGQVLIEFPELLKRFDVFRMRTEAGQIRNGEVVGVVGPNATGKTTFVKMLAGEIEPTSGELAVKAKVSYKPQYIKMDFSGTVGDLMINRLGGSVLDDLFFKSEVERPLNIRTLWEKNVTELSGGELQRVALALALGAKEVEIYLLDEPSAYLDSNQRMEAATAIRRVMEKSGKSAFIVDHDIYFIDLVSDSLMVFEGTPSVEGRGAGPFGMRDGMNRFLKNVGITFRRDNDTKRPRINKQDSRLDKEQKLKGEYYYQE